MIIVFGNLKFQVCVYIYTMDFAIFMYMAILLSILVVQLL
jgi:hypothetical protein